MVASPDLWDRIEGTRNPATEEHNVSGRYPLGIMRVVETKWTAQGQGEVEGACYVLEATEHEPRGRVATLLGAEPSLSAKLLKDLPAWEGRPATRAAYIVSLAADGQLHVQGAIREMSDPIDGDGSSINQEVPVRMTPQEAMAGFELALGDANFG